MKNKSNRIRSIIRRLIVIVIGFVVGLNVYLTNASAVAGNKFPMPLGFGASTVMSGSMEPTLHVGDLIIVRETKDIEVGDIVVYQTGDSLVVHRAIMVTQDQVITQGDANNTADPEFDIENVKGVVIFHIPWIGTIATIIKTPAVTIILLIVAFLLIELSYRKTKDQDEVKLDAIKDEIIRLKDEINSGSDEMK